MPTPYDEAREKKLPRWAQDLLADMRREAERLQTKNANVEAAHEVLTGRNWFTLEGPPMDGDETARKFFLLNRDGAQPVCSIGRGDVLLIGRAREGERS